MSIKIEFKIKCLKCNKDHSSWQEYVDCLIDKPKQEERTFGENLISALQEMFDHKNGKIKLRESLVTTNELPKKSFGKKRASKKSLPKLKKKKKK